jgi:Spy/CpxP family protein refolding chaperone
MLKKYLLILTAAGAMTMLPFAAAQDSQSNGQGNATSDQSAPPAQENGGGRHHGGMDPERRSAELTKKLNLSSDQQAKVLSALQSEKSQMESVHQDSSLSPQDRHSKMMDIRTATDSQIRGVLNADQQKKFDQMQERREQRMGNRGGAAPDANSGQQAPPQ